MKASEVRKNWKQVLDEAVQTGKPIYFERSGTMFKIEAYVGGIQLPTPKYSIGQDLGSPDGDSTVIVKHHPNGKLEVIDQEYTPPKKNTALPDGKKTIHFESTPVGENEFHKIATDKKSSLVRPDIPPTKDEFEEALNAAEGECCRKNTPCKHWIWSPERVCYINSLSGRTKEADE